MINMTNQIQQNFRLSPYWVDGVAATSFDWEKFQDKIDATPDSLYNILVDETTINFIKSLTQKYTQLSAKGPDVARLIRDVVIADAFLGDMPQETSRRLGLDLNTARQVANQIVSQLFMPALNELTRLHKERFPGRELPQVPTPETPKVPTPQAQSPRPPMQTYRPQTPPSIQRPQQPQQPQQNFSPTPRNNYPGQDLPESGGNIVNLRGKP